MGAQGTVVLDFGAFPGVSHASVAVTGQGTIVAGSLVEAWIRPEATPDHTADEHMVESLRVIAADIIPSTGFSVHGFNTSEIHEPLVPFKGLTHTLAGGLSAPQGFQQPSNGGIGTRIWGRWTCAWVWN